MIFGLDIMQTLSNDCPEPHMQVYLSVSSLASTSDNGIVTQRRLEMNWYGDSPQIQDRVELLSHDPIYGIVAVMMVFPVDYSDSWVTTEVEFERPDLSASPGACLGYWVAYYRGDVLLSSNCLRSQPQWMWENRELLGDRRLIDLVLPGTHDSGAYEEYRGAISDNPVTMYAITQEESIFNQLMYGVRYLDLRPSFYNDTEEQYWLNHGLYRIRPFSLILDDIVRFMNLSNDLLIIHIGGWNGEFSQFPEKYLEFTDMLEFQLEEWLAPASMGVNATLSDFLNSGKRLIMINEHHADGDPYPWAEFEDTYNGDNTPEKLMATLEEFLDKTPLPDPWLLSGEQTPNVADVIFNRLGGLRVMASEVDRNITQRIQADWWTTVSVVIHDFFMAANNIDMAIHTNLRRQRCNITNPW